MFPTVGFSKNQIKSNTFIVITQQLYNDISLHLIYLVFWAIYYFLAYGKEVVYVLFSLMESLCSL